MDEYVKRPEGNEAYGKRPGWDEYFGAITKQVATRSTCLRRKVGAIIVKDKRILTTGYNGAPKGVKNCLERGNASGRKWAYRRDRGMKSAGGFMLNRMQ